MGSLEKIVEIIGQVVECFLLSWQVGANYFVAPKCLQEKFLSTKNFIFMTTCEIIKCVSS